jgi:hypothetical protein
VPRLGPDLAAAAGLAARLARDIGPQPAAAWVHAAAMTRHAAQAGLTGPPRPRGDPAGTIRAAAGQMAAAHPALASLADPAVCPIWDVPLPASAAAEVAALWQDADLIPEPERIDGYLIGDLYQALSAEARKRALCQTPRFVTRLLLDLAFDPAGEEHGWPELRAIDPACGTGHILVEMFCRAAPELRTRPVDAGVEAALRVVHGVDIDPYAALIARYRLLAVACRWGGRRLRLQDLPVGLPVQVAAADALLGTADGLVPAAEPLLEHGRYHAVIANAPYMTCEDPKAREMIRRRYRQVCSGQFPQAVPFEVLMHDLCVPGGRVARLTANSFMKREFRRKLTEEYFATIDLQWVIDTSGAYIPGHGTPTVILVSRSQLPSSPDVRAILGKRGEPSVPADRPGGWCGLTSPARSGNGCRPNGSPAPPPNTRPARQADAPRPGQPGAQRPDPRRHRRRMAAAGLHHGPARPCWPPGRPPSCGRWS